MAYFQKQKRPEQEQYTRLFQTGQVELPVRPEEFGAFPDQNSSPEEELDDGFDQLSEDAQPEKEISEEERWSEKRRKLRIAAGAGDFLAVLAGVALILLMTALLIHMAQFLSTDLTQSFSVLQTRF